MKIMGKMMWMASGVGAGMLLQKYNKDIMKMFKKQSNKMMKVQTHK